MKMIATARIGQAAARVGENAPMAATCCNACRTCVQTNLLTLGIAAVVGAGAWIRSIVRRETPGP